MAGRKREFRLPYAGIDRYGDWTLLYGDHGDFSVIFAITNSVIRYGGDPNAFTEYHTLLLNLVKVIGEGHYLQKLDVFSRQRYQPLPADTYLQRHYQQHFAGRAYTGITTYLVITRQVRRGTFYVFDPKALDDFAALAAKAEDLLRSGGLSPRRLDRRSADHLVARLLSMDFTSTGIARQNIRAGDAALGLGERSVRTITLVDTDRVDLPEALRPYAGRNDRDALRGFPLDNLDFLHAVPGADTVVYNQVINIPGQQATIGRLEQKRKRHSGVPDPANQICVEDIDRMLENVARNNQLLVQSHFSIAVAAPPEALEKAANAIEAALFQAGIIPSVNAYNQLELFRAALPGNAGELKKYDWFLTTAEAALCLWFKESQQVDEPSDFLIRFTDRRGIPVAIDPSDLSTGRLNSRNRFVLGPSGSGKSFFMNSLLEQYAQYNMDIVIVDTGDSYSGLCSYFGGRYITYTEQQPITMNPFAISREEFNLEKKDFLKTLVALLWKGVDGSLSQVEDTVLSNVISAYYHAYFWQDPQPGRPDKLDFDSFYVFSIDRIADIREKERIPFDLDEYRYVLRKFHTGGEFGTILNEATDQSLFSEPFIVYEIDAIKENKTIFPIVTLSIMDVFLQKMRHRQDRRKALIVEEAWKAIASPMMAGYLLYLYKTVRKFWGEVIVVTQELGDILGNAVVKDSIVNNSDTVFLLDQSKFRDNFNAIAKLLSINETERRKIFTINQLDNREGRGRFKEVYGRRGSVGEVYGVEVSLPQYLAFTTEKPEKRAVETYVARHGSYPAALDAFIADLRSSGLSLPAFVAKVNSA